MSETNKKILGHNEVQALISKKLELLQPAEPAKGIIDGARATAQLANAFDHQIRSKLSYHKARGEKPKMEYMER